MPAGNTATVTGNNSTAYAEIGDTNTAIVSGDGSSAYAGGILDPFALSSDNTATVTGDGLAAVATAGGQTVVIP